MGLFVVAGELDFGRFLGCGHGEGVAVGGGDVLFLRPGGVDGVLGDEFVEDGGDYFGFVESVVFVNWVNGTGVVVKFRRTRR